MYIVCTAMWWDMPSFNAKPSKKGKMPVLPKANSIVCGLEKCVKTTECFDLKQ